MEKIICRLLKQNPDSREGVIASVSVLGIAVNLLTAIIKVVIGAAASSIAIISEGVNNATDALTSLLTFAGTKLAGKHPDKKHPFGYGRIEYLTGLIIAVLILVTGIEMLTSSVKLIFDPAELNISVISLVIVGLSAVIKFFLGTYTVKRGKEVDSAALTAVGLECRNDSFFSAVTIISAVLFLLFHISVDAYAGALISLIIIKAGFDVLKETVSELIGRPGEEELAEQLYKEIRSSEGIINAADMMLHNYGPESWSGSVNIELDHKKTVGEVYRIIHALQLRIMHEYKVTMVFGIYAVDNDSKDVAKLRNEISDFIRRHDEVKGYHALYIEPDTNRIYVDLVMDYGRKDWEAVEREFKSAMAQLYPDKSFELTLETEYV